MTEPRVNTGNLEIIPLGGASEIGKNLTLIRYGEAMIAVDCGIAFPYDELYGVDIVVPDISFLRDNRSQFLGIFLTHGHEDHIGGLSFVLKEFDVPVYGSRLTIGLVRSKLREYLDVEKLRLIEFSPDQVVKKGPFSVEPIRVTHSIPETVAYNIETPAGRLIYVSDFKIDHTPVDEWYFDSARFATLGEDGVLAMISDSTNAEQPGYSPSEIEVGETLEGIIRNAPGRVIISMFASSIHRMQQILDKAAQFNRKVAVLGRSMQNNLDISIQMGYISVPDDTLISGDAINQYQMDELVVMCTGSQGEPLSALSRISKEEYRMLRIVPGDTVILAASPIPGNEGLIWRTVNRLFRQGANVIYPPKAAVHASGHGSQEELKMLISLVQPQYLIPLHGEPRMLSSYREMAVKMGYDSECVFPLENGDVLSLNEQQAGVVDHVKVGKILIDVGRTSEVSSVILKERKRLANDGLITISVSIDSEVGSFVSGPNIDIMGLAISESDKQQFVEETSAAVVKCLDKEADYNDGDEINLPQLKETVRITVLQVAKRRLKRKPVVIAQLMPV